MIEQAKAGNPYGRLTEPADIAGAGGPARPRPEAAWITGNVIRVDERRDDRRGSQWGYRVEKDSMGEFQVPEDRPLRGTDPPVR